MGCRLSDNHRAVSRPSVNSGQAGAGGAEEFLDRFLSATLRLCESWFGASPVDFELGMRHFALDKPVEQKVTEETEKAEFCFRGAAALSWFAPVRVSGFCPGGIFFLFLVGPYSASVGSPRLSKSLAVRKLARQGEALFAEYRPGVGAVFTRG
jgi:hypothetical protein